MLGKGVKIRNFSRRCLIAAGAGLLATRAARAAAAVVVASKIDTEGALLGNLIALTLRAHGLAVTTRLQLGPTRILRQALLSGAIDIYPEYTGNGAQFFRRAGDPVWHNAKAAYDTVRELDHAQNNLVWLTPAPADNGWGIAVPRAFAAAAHLASLADFARTVNGGARVRLAASVEFVESADALPAFEHAYGFRLRQGQLLMLAGGDTSATLRAAAEGLSGIDAAMSYGTDGALGALGLTLLEDPLHAQIAFQPAPVVRAPVLAAHPQIAAWLAPVFAGLTRKVLQGLNAQVAGAGAEPRTVAAAYLRKAGLA